MPYSEDDETCLNDCAMSNGFTRLHHASRWNQPVKFIYSVLEITAVGGAMLSGRYK